MTPFLCSLIQSQAHLVNPARPFHSCSLSHQLFQSSLVSKYQVHQGYLAQSKASFNPGSVKAAVVRRSMLPVALFCQDP